MFDNLDNIRLRKTTTTTTTTKTTTTQMQTNTQTKTRTETNINEKLIKSILPIKKNRIELTSKWKKKTLHNGNTEIVSFGPPCQKNIFFDGQKLRIDLAKNLQGSNNLVKESEIWNQNRRNPK